MDLQFVAENLDVDIYGIPNGIEATGKVVVNWHIGIDSKSWGIREIDLVIDSVKASIDWNFEDEDETDIVLPEEFIGSGGFVELDESKFAITCTVTSDDDGGLQIISAEIDLKSKTITLN